MTAAASRYAFTLVLLSASATAACAQGGRGGHGGMGGSMGMPGGGRMGGPMGMPRTESGMSGGGGSVPSFPRGSSPGSSGTRGGLQMGPPGRWWDDKKFAKSLGLNSDQQKRMDGIFGQNRDSLQQHNDALQRAESRLDAVTHTGKPTEAALFAEIDHVAQARAELEKSYAHMLLQLRDEMTSDQIGKLDDSR